MPNVLSPRDLVSRPDIMDETVPHNCSKLNLPCHGHSSSKSKGLKFPERATVKVAFHL